MVIEDILAGLVKLVLDGTIKDGWHRNFIVNVQEHVTNRSPLSTNQSNVIIKAARTHMVALVKALNSTAATVDHALQHPTYKTAPYQSKSVVREVRYLGVDKLAFRFKRDPTIIEEIKGLRSANDIMSTGAKWNNQYALWIVTVTTGTLDKIMGIIQRHKFSFDDPVLEYITLCHNSKKAASTFELVPDSDIIVANVVNNPLLETVLEGMFGAEYI